MRPTLGHHAVGEVPARRERELPRVVSPLEYERQGGRGSDRVVFVGAGPFLVFGLARLGIDLRQRIDILVAAIGPFQVEADAQPEVAHADAEKRPFGVVPAVGGEGFGVGQQVLRQQRDPEVEADVVFVHRLERVEGYGRPTVDFNEGKGFGIAPRTVPGVRRG